MIFPHPRERAGVLWETGSAETGTGLQTSGADALIQANSLGNVTKAGVDLLASSATSLM